uniref:5'-nucleotidase domain-containing protein 1 isoform X2 n=1 Tax=Myxine glutinosa TaxID=7769 RepID=UPI00358E77B0
MEMASACTRYMRGLILECLQGNLLKLDKEGRILRASHGTRAMSRADIIEQYGPEMRWKHFESFSKSLVSPPQCHFFDNFVEQSGALLCARIVDLMDKAGASDTKTYTFWKDVIAAVEQNYNPRSFKADRGGYFPALKRTPGKYLRAPTPVLTNWLSKLRSAGKVTVLLTSSHSDYCRLVASHTLGVDFENLFDVIISYALKPGFFSEKPIRRPFLTLEQDVEGPALSELPGPGWYSQGNWTQLHSLLQRLTGKASPKMVYVGDSIRCDILAASQRANLDTVLVLEELVDTVSGKQGLDCKVQKKLDLEGNSSGVSIQREPPCKRTKWKNIPLTNTDNGFWGPMFYDGGIADVNDSSPKETFFHAVMEQHASLVLPSVEVLASVPLNYKFPCTSACRDSTAKSCSNE